MILKALTDQLLPVLLTIIAYPLGYWIGAKRKLFTGVEASLMIAALTAMALTLVLYEISHIKVMIFSNAIAAIYMIGYVSPGENLNVQNGRAVVMLRGTAFIVLAAIPALMLLQIGLGYEKVILAVGEYTQIKIGRDAAGLILLEYGVWLVLAGFYYVKHGKNSFAAR